MNNWVEISEQNLADNYRVLKSAAGNETDLLAVVKANGYGHGAELCATVLTRAGVPWLGVSCASEGVRVRQALEAAGFGLESGRAAKILILCGFLPSDVSLVYDYQLTPVVWTAEQIGWLLAKEVADTRAPSFHLEIDTGMGRQGVEPGVNLGALLDLIVASGLHVDGVFTHFCSSEVACSELTQLQERRFEAAIAQVRARGIQPAFVHAGASSALDNPAQKDPWLLQLAASVGARALVRTGLALYGYCLPIERAANCITEPCVRDALKPVMTWKAHVLSVQELEVGQTVGYNATFTADRRMRVALLAVGYADGLRRELSSANGRSGGWVMLHGRRARILGRISMNLTVVDLAEMDGVKSGDVALLLGEGVTAEDHAWLAGTIAYEILCGIHPCG